MNLSKLIGVGLRHPHYSYVIENSPGVGWFEVHSENFFHQGGPSLEALIKIRKNYPISLHGVGLSLGSAEGISAKHLSILKNLIDYVDPFLVSEHLSWGYIDGNFLPDLLPIPYTKEGLKIFALNILQTQDFLKKEILIENPSSYIEYSVSEIEEVDFLVELCTKTSAKILLDVNNIYVSCYNHGWDPKQYLDKIPKNLVKEIHLAGHSIKEIGKAKTILIDTHDNFVCREVWELYDYAISRFGLVPTLLEWDANIPSFEVLLNESSKMIPFFKKYYEK